MSAGQSKRLLESLRLGLRGSAGQATHNGCWEGATGWRPTLDEPEFLVAQTRCNEGRRTELCKIWFLVDRGGASRCLGWRETGEGSWRVLGLAGPLCCVPGGLGRGMAGRG